MRAIDAGWMKIERGSGLGERRVFGAAGRAGQGRWEHGSVSVGMRIAGGPCWRVIGRVAEWVMQNSEWRCKVQRDRNADEGVTTLRCRKVSAVGQ